MVQLATRAANGSRHTQLRDDVEQQVGNINGEFGRLGRPVECTTCTAGGPRRADRDVHVCGRHARHAPARRDESRRQGICRVSRLGHRRARPPANSPVLQRNFDAHLVEPARSGRGQACDRRCRDGRARARVQRDALDAPGHEARRRPLSANVSRRSPRRPGRDRVISCSVRGGRRSSILGFTRNS